MLVGHLVWWRTPRVMQIVWMKLQKTRHHALPSLNGCFQVMLEIEQNSSKIDCNVQQRRLNLHRSCSPSLPYPWIRTCLGYFPEIALLKSFFFVGSSIPKFGWQQPPCYRVYMLEKTAACLANVGQCIFCHVFCRLQFACWWVEMSIINGLMRRNKYSTPLCIYMILHVCFCMDWLLCDAKGI